MNCGVEIGVGVMIYIPSFIKIGLGMQNLLDGIHIKHADSKVSLV
jgi:hypothetical protein